MKKYCLMAWPMFMIIVLVTSQSPNGVGFINVDCGLSRYESPYSELTTRLTYTTDADLVESGVSGRIDKIFETMYQRPYWTVRSFPKPERNCYKINTVRKTKYLIRAKFLYGNYDGRNTVPSFDLYLGPNLWTVVEANSTTKEVIHHTASQSSLQICLVNTGSGTPFINVVELRPLNRDAYTTPSGSLKMLFRWYLGNPEGEVIWYPSDVYDRYWYPPSQQKHLIPITTTLNVSTKNEYNPPETVMATAATPLDANASWTVEWVVEPPTTQCYPYLYFSELQTLGANETREFIVFLNAEVFHRPTNPKPFITTTMFDRLPSQCTDGKCVLQLMKTSTSTLPPVLSAIEVYTVMDLLQVETNEDDVTGIKDVQSTYELDKMSWQGDPCIPKQFLWEGLSCNYSDNSTRPTVITLDLSSSGLTGVIAEAIKNLAHLQHLDLSNNSLSGGVPEFLADMSSLLVINLSSNNLSGSVPQTLAQKKGMELNIEGNPLLICTTGTSCVNKQGKDGDRIKNIVVAVVVASLALIITALLILCLYRHKRRPSVIEGPRSNMQELDALPLPFGMHSEISL